MGSVKIDLTFADEDPATVVALLEEIGGKDLKQVEQRGFAGIELIVAGIVLTQALATLITRLARLWKCGMIVDARGPTVTTEKNCDLPRGSVVILEGGGEVTLDQPTEADVSAVLKELIAKR